MAKLIECASCGGLKRADSLCCPHCRTQVSSLLKSSLAAAGFGALAACGSGTPPTACIPEPLGGCEAVEAPDGSHVPIDAYGVIAFPQDGGSDGNFTGVDAYGIAPFRDGGPGFGDDDD
jgi:hypothetical protein